MVSEQGDEGDTSTIRVLHVDDEPRLTELTATYLERQDDRLEVLTETGPTAALERLDAERFDCVVSDYDMPERNGIELLEAVRDTSPELPFILFTGNGSEEVASEAISRGVTDYLRKGTGSERYAILANRITNAVEARRSTRALEERKRRLETLISNLPGVVYRCRIEPGWPMDTVEGECEELTGYSAAQLERGDVSWGEDLIHPTDREDTWAAVESALGADEPFEVTYRIEAAGGEVRWVWERGRRVDDGILEGFMTDITTREQREGELERTNALLSTLFETLPAGVLVEDDDRSVRTANRQLFDLLDLPGDPADVVGEDCAELAREVSDRFATPGGFVRDLDTLTTERQPDERTVELADGRTLKRLYRPVEFPEGKGNLWVYRDVTERVASRTELERYERIIEASGDPVYTLDADGHFTYVNERLAGMVGNDRESLLGEHASMVMADEGDVDTMERAIGRLWNSDDENYAIVEIDVLTASGERIPAEVHASLLPSEGEFRGTVGVVRDVSERVARERKLERVRDRVRAFMHTETRTETAEIAMRAAEDIIGAPLGGVHLLDEAQELLVPRSVVDGAKVVFDELPRYPRAAPEGTAAAVVWDVFERGGSLRIDDTREYEPLTEERPARSVIVHSLGDHGIFIVSSREANAFDDTDEVLVEVLATSLEAAFDRVARETELRKRNEQLDEFASLVSHDLRNPLSVARGHAELLGESVDAPAHLDPLDRALDRMAVLIEDTLELSRRGKRVSEVEPVPVSELVDRCWELVESGDATVSVTETFRLSADRERLCSVFENLFRNAVEHGSVERDADDSGSDAGTVTVEVGRSGERSFYVADDGPGIPPEDRDAALEPGYTTIRDGTGFGLAIVKRIADAHGWEVSLAVSETGGLRVEFSDVDIASGSGSDE